MILIRRGRESKYGTFGLLTMPGFSCLSLELPDRNNKTNLSRIPAGRYEMQRVITRRPFSGRPDSFWLKDVRGRTGILIHSGNYAGDTLQGLKAHSWGCILLGSDAVWLNGQPAITNSVNTVWRFMSLLGDHETIEVI